MKFFLNLIVNISLLFSFIRINTFIYKRSMVIIKVVLIDAAKSIKEMEFL